MTFSPVFFPNGWRSHTEMQFNEVFNDESYSYARMLVKPTFNTLDDNWFSRYFAIIENLEQYIENSCICKHLYSNKNLVSILFGYDCHVSGLLKWHSFRCEESLRLIAFVRKWKIIIINLYMGVCVCLAAYQFHNLSRLSNIPSWTHNGWFGAMQLECVGCNAASIPKWILFGIVLDCTILLYIINEKPSERKGETECQRAEKWINIEIPA